MLCDDVCTQICDMAFGNASLKDFGTGNLPSDRKAVLAIAALIQDGDTVRHAVDGRAFELIDDLCVDGSALERSRNDVFLPHSNVWFEYHSDVGRMGFLVVTRIEGRQDHLVEGKSGYVSTISVTPDGSIDIVNVMFDLNAPAGQDWIWGMHPSIQGEDRKTAIKTIQSTLLAFCVVMATPRLVDRDPADLAKLNVARDRKRKPRLLQYSVLRLTKTACAAYAETRPSHTAPDGSKRAFHRVRTFLRVRNAKAHFVRSHTRGSREIGVKTHVRVTAGRPMIENRAL